MDDIRLIAGVFALAVVVVVWAMNPSIGDRLTKRKPLMPSAGCTPEQHSDGGSDAT